MFKGKRYQENVKKVVHSIF